MGLAAPVHSCRVRRAPRHAVPRHRRRLPEQGHGRGLPARLRRPLRAPGPAGCAVTRVEQVADGFVVHTSHGPLSTRQVVIATGPFQDPVIPGVAAGLPDDVVQLHSAEYRRPGDLPAGPVVVVGAGNSGRQIAEELAATHEVTLAVGTAPPQLPQRFLGRDLFWWLTRLGLMDKTAESRLARRMRERGDLVIGTPLKRLRGAGVQHPAPVVSTTGNEVTFQDGTSVRAAAVVWATGFRADYSWVDVPDAFDEQGHPRHERGITAVPGLAFVGLPWQHTRGSALLGFVQSDAAWVAGQLEADRRQQRNADLVACLRRRVPPAACTAPHTEWTASGQSSRTASSHQTSPTLGARHDHHHLTGHHTRHPARPGRQHRLTRRPRRARSTSAG